MDMSPEALKNLVRIAVVPGFVEAEDNVPAVKLREVWHIIGSHIIAVRLALILPSLIVAPFCPEIRNMVQVTIIPVLICRHINCLLSNDDGIDLVFGKPGNLDDLGGCTIEYCGRTASLFRAARCLLRVSAAAGKVVACHFGFGKVSGRLLTGEAYNWIHGITGLIFIEIEIPDTFANIEFFFDGTESRSLRA